MSAPDRAGDILADLDATPSIGHNGPPEPTPLEAHTIAISDIHDEARNFLDGAPIENQGQADAVTKLRDDAKKAWKAADAQRAAEKKPHDDAGKAVQAAWKPVLDRADKVDKAGAGALAVWLAKDQARRQREADELARLAAEEDAKAKAAHSAAAATGDLDALEAAESLIDNAALLARETKAAYKAKPMAKVKGMARGVTLRTVYDVTLSDEATAARDLLRWAYAAAPAEMVEFALAMAQKASRTTGAAIPGCNVVGRQVV